MINNKISDIFQTIGDILEIKNENQFKVRSYHRASQIIHGLPKSLSDMYEKDPKDIMAISGIGKDLFQKIVEIIEYGKCKYLEELMKTFPAGLLEMLKLRGIGPKKVKLIYTNLGITTIRDLDQAAKDGIIHDLPGMGEKTEQEIIKSIANLDKYSARELMPIALDEAEIIIAYLKKHKSVDVAQYAGSLRRRKETVGDIDILVSTDKDSGDVMDYFVKYPGVTEVLAHGDTKSSIVLENGIQVDLRVIEEKSFGAAMHYFTGSKAHNIIIRDIAKKRGLKINEYGVFKGEKMIGGETEEEVFGSIDLPYIIPELRKNDGEIEAAMKGNLPKSIDIKDIKGDLHMHTNESDATQPLEEVAREFYEAGYKYIAITDHSKSSTVTNGLDIKRLQKQFKEIDKLNKMYESKDFKILKGCEVDILADGRLDFPDEFLEQMDIFPASIHSGFVMKEADMTNRIVNALKNPHVKILGHPTGRLINKREPYEVDMEAVIQAAKDYKVALELNSQPYRLDLTDKYLRRAKEKGVKIVINTDSHHSSQMMYLKYGIYIARRGWLEKSDVLNTRPLHKLFDYWKK